MNKFILTIILSALVVLNPSVSSAQQRSSGKGFNYAAHQKMNKKAKRWGKRRIKAADGDQTNVQCSVRSSRKHRRKNG